MELKRFHHSEPNIYAIAAGFLAVSSVSAALFLWGLVKWRKKSKEKASVSINSRSENALIFPAPTLPPLPGFPPESYNVRISDFIFDPEIDYAQVLAEAQKFVAEANLPETATTALSTEARPSQGHTSKSGQAKLLTDNTLEENKSKSSWKNSWLFWQRSKRNDSVNGYCSVSTMPAYPSRKALKRSLSGPMPSYSSTRKSSSNSGPIYSDGLPLRPANRSRSGSLSGSATPDRSYAMESPYEQLNSKAHSTYRHLYKV